VRYRKYGDCSIARITSDAPFAKVLRVPVRDDPVL
jgi:hypothetical protein